MVRIVGSTRPAAAWTRTPGGTLPSPSSEPALLERLRPVSTSALSRFEQWGKAAFGQLPAVSPRSSSVGLLSIPPNVETTSSGRTLDMGELLTVQAARAGHQVERSHVISSSNRYQGHTIVSLREPAVRAPTKVPNSAMRRPAADAAASRDEHPSAQVMTRVRGQGSRNEVKLAPANNNPWSTHLTRHPEPGETKGKRDRPKKAVADLHAQMSASDIQMGTTKSKPTELDDHAAKHTEGARALGARTVLRAAIQTVMVAGTTNGMKRKGRSHSSHRRKPREEMGEAHRAMRLRLIDRESHALSVAEDYVELAFQ